MAIVSLPGFPEAAPLEGFIGGLLIGLAAAIMLLGLGRIAGVSGLAARAVGLSDGGPSRPVAALFVTGLILGAIVFAVAIGPIEAEFAPSVWWMGAGGLLVGIGTRLGSGCTSGHGVCGMSRLSRRSIVATLTFMASGFATVAIVNLVGGAW
ncbi:YeeE/YedE family protein [Aurantiacibacter gangjinensis]|uniref:Membrane protein n=1 Tax=Aurantiacibacter gangjinensis TaxID=502682 RepID=A0A0G9MK59_9SPHN|nr:YeeE/YedE thiosulfate transporter family protein [Aurantiacibacter gangjinensis]APE29335.1 putative transmembrane protein [Aurantiacibacter gangjinensis]KLE31080.1 membrane protein [Aurantiacibacter gangjinensis]